jgi:hypothetical protein
VGKKVKKTTVTLVFLMFVLTSCAVKKVQNISHAAVDEYLYIGGLRYELKLPELDRITDFSLKLHPTDEKASNSLEGIELLKNLEKLNIKGVNYWVDKENSWMGTDISGIDFSPLKSLKKLKKLEFFDAVLNEIPDLSEIPSLEFIDFYRCEIISLNGIEKVNQIKRLEFDFENDYLGDFTVFSKLTKLEKLSIFHCYSGSKEMKKYTFQLTDLSGMKGLKSLSLGYFGTIDLSGIQNLSNLEYLSLAKANVTNIQEISLLRNLQTLDDLNIPVSVTSLNFLAPLTKLIKLGLYGNGNTIDIDPLKNIINLEQLMLFNFTILNFHVLDTLTKLSFVITPDSKFLPEDNNKLKHAEVFYSNELH